MTGAVVQQDDDSTKTVYGKMIHQRTILSGKVGTPAVATSFMTAVRHGSALASAEELSDKK